MELTKFGRSAIALSQVVTIQDIPPSDEDPPGVRVYFQGTQVVVFRGEDADLIRRFVAGLPDPCEARPPNGHMTAVPVAAPRLAEGDPGAARVE